MLSLLLNLLGKFDKVSLIKVLVLLVIKWLNDVYPCMSFSL